MGSTFKSNWKYIGEEVYGRFVEHEWEKPSLGAVESEYEWDIPITQAIFVDFTGLLLISLISCEESLDEEDWNHETVIGFRKYLESIETEEQKDNAYELLSDISLPEVIPDIAIVNYFETVIEMLHSEYYEEWGKFFASLVFDFIEKFNMCYRLTLDYRILPLMTSEIYDIYDRISSECGPHGDLLELWCDFEEAYAHLVKNQTTHKDFKTPLGKGCMYLEAIAADFSSSKRSTNFSNAVKNFERSSKFPTKGSFTRSINALYGFASEYPGIRHAGTPSSKLREMSIQDMNHIGLLFLVWAGYMHSLKELES